MPTTKNILAATGAVAIIALVLNETAKKLIANVIITPGTPQMDNTPFAQGFIKVDVPVTIQNLNPMPIGLKYFFGNVTYGDLTLSEVSIPTAFSIPSGATRTINLDMDIPINTVLGDITTIIAQGNWWNAVLNKIELNGTLQVQGNFTNIPINIDRIAIPLT